METATGTKTTITLFDRENFQLQNTIFFNIVTTTSYAFLPAMNRSLHAALVKIYTSADYPLSLFPLLKHTTPCLTVLIFTVWSPSTFSKHQGMSVGAILLHIKEFSDTFLLHMHFHIRHCGPR